MSERVGVIGVGWGALVHAPAFRLVDGFDVVALCGRRPERVSRAAARLDLTDTMTDWERFVRRDDLDVIAIAAPVALHRPMFEAALAAGKDVLCEKPLGRNAGEARAMADAAAEAEAGGQRTAICFEMRWTPERLAVRDLVADGAVGQPYFVQVSRMGSYWHPDHPAQSTWMYRLDEGGGYLNGMMSHEIDFVQSLFGPAVAVCADVRTTVRRRPGPDSTVIEVDADDTSAVIMRLGSGALAVVTSSVVGFQASGQTFEALGRDGSIEIARVGGTGPAIVSRRDGGDSRPIEPSTRTVPGAADLPGQRSAEAIAAMALLLEDWRPAFDGGTSGAPTVRDGWLVQEVIDAARRSAAGAGWIDLSEHPS